MKITKDQITIKSKKVCFDTDVSNISEVKKSILNDSNSPKYGVFMNTHMFISCLENQKLLNAINNAKYIFADGRPIYFFRKIFGSNNKEHIRGMDFTLELLKFCEMEGISVGFLGSTDEVLESMKKNLICQYPKLKISYNYSPPFTELSDELINDISKNIESNRVICLFVGLGCPKQELLMAEIGQLINCHMFGVGAVFDFIAGKRLEAPVLFQKLGMEWFFRLTTDFRRLLKRYLYCNSKFLGLSIFLIIRYLFKGKV